MYLITREELIEMISKIQSKYGKCLDLIMEKDIVDEMLADKQQVENISKDRIKRILVSYAEDIYNSDIFDAAGLRLGEYDLTPEMYDIIEQIANEILGKND